MSPSSGKWDNACESLLYTKNIIYSYSCYHHHLIFCGPNFLCLPSWHLTKLRHDSMLTKTVARAHRLFYPPSFLAFTHHLASARLRGWHLEVSHRRMTGMCVCLCQVKRGGGLRPTTYHIPCWQPRLCTQHRVVWGINKAGRAKN